MALVIFILVLFGIITFFLKGEKWQTERRSIFLTGALIHNLGSVLVFFMPDFLSFPPYIHIDNIGRLFLVLTSFVFTIVSIYSLGYFPAKRSVSSDESGRHIFVSCMFFFLASMTLVISTAHLGILWVAIETTTLSTAPLIYYRQNQRSLEAAWKYLLICSVGIAIALLGIFFVASSTKGTGADISISSLMENANRLDKRLLRIGFILVLTGFGTKMGLAPLHSWLPDAHSEAPSPISALLSGALLNCAFLGVLRFFQITSFSGLHDFAGRLMVMFGLVSLGVAAIFVTSQKDYKRLFAYSSIEHMGIIALGIGIGANFASMLHVVAHSLTKSLLFLVAGNLLILYKTKKASEISGLLRSSPATGILLTVSGLAILGLPPFLPFISEFLILQHGLKTGRPVTMFFYLFFLSIIFISMSRIILKMVHGKQREQIPHTLPAMLVAPPAVLAIAVLCFGIYLPDSVSVLINAAARMLNII